METCSGSHSHLAFDPWPCASQQFFMSSAFGDGRKRACCVHHNPWAVTVCVLFPVFAARMFLFKEQQLFCGLAQTLNMLWLFLVIFPPHFLHICSFLSLFLGEVAPLGKCYSINFACIVLGWELLPCFLPYLFPYNRGIVSTSVVFIKTSLALCRHLFPIILLILPPLSHRTSFCLPETATYFTLLPGFNVHT